MKVWVTGAGGYIGRHVVRQLLDDGHQVIACDIRGDELDSRAVFARADIFSENTLLEEYGVPDVCIHLAVRNGFVHQSPGHLEDLPRHFHFLTSLIDAGLSRLVVMGTMHEVGYHEGMIDENTPCNPLSLYAISKDALRRSLEIYCRTKDCNLLWLRGFYLLGDDGHNHSIFSKLLEAARDGKKTFPFTSGKTRYDFLSVDELALMIARASEQDRVKGIICCCSGKPVSLGERVEQFIRENGLDIRLDYGAFPDRPYDSPCIYGDPSKIQSILNAKG